MKYSEGNRQNFKDTKNKNLSQTARLGLLAQLYSDARYACASPKRAHRPSRKHHLSHAHQIGFGFFLLFFPACWQQYSTFYWLCPDPPVLGCGAHFDWQKKNTDLSFTRWRTRKKTTDFKFHQCNCFAVMSCCAHQPCY